MGALTAKAAMNARNRTMPTVDEKGCVADRVTRSNVRCPVLRWWRYTTVSRPTSMTADPRKVYRKNFSAA